MAIGCHAMHWLVLACYVIPVLMPLTNVHGWTGAWSPAARFLVPVSPLLWLGVYAYAAQAALGGRIVVTALVAVQLAIDALVWQFPKTLWNDGDGVSAFRWNQWMPTWTDSQATLAFASALGTAFAFAYVCFRFAAVADQSGGSDKSSPAVSVSASAEPESARHGSGPALATVEVESDGKVCTECSVFNGPALDRRALARLRDSRSKHGNPNRYRKDTS